jgi:hypothetical protein
MRTAGGGKKTISPEKFDSVRSAIMEPNGRQAAVRKPEGVAAKPAMQADPAQRRYTDGGKALSAGDPGINARLTPTGGKSPPAATADDRRRQASAAKARLAPLLKEADAFLERARLHDIEKSTQEGREAIVRRLKAKYP